MTTPLYARLQELIAQEGPMTVERFMSLCLSDPAHGYYMTRDPLGLGGDFTTSPEISQIFGELIGLWAVQFWADMNTPPVIHLVEMGPGRGTLMADALRAARIVPRFMAAVQVHLVETSPALRAAQQKTLASCGLTPTWHQRFDTIPAGPVIVLANEFFDALPVRQFVSQSGSWFERMIGRNDAGNLIFGFETEPVRGMNVTARDEDVLEIGFISLSIMEKIAARIASEGGGALIIDYGHPATAFGDTLQAVKGHKFADILSSAGEADLTAHVDFGALQRQARTMGASTHGPITQGALLERLGAPERAAKLKAVAATDAERVAIDVAMRRLMGAGPEEMGKLFKALALSAPQMTIPAGFETLDPLI